MKRGRGRPVGSLSKNKTGNTKDPNQPKRRPGRPRKGETQQGKKANQQLLPSSIPFQVLAQAANNQAKTHGETKIYKAERDQRLWDECHRPGKFSGFINGGQWVYSWKYCGYFKKIVCASDKPAVDLPPHIYYARSSVTNAFEFVFEDNEIAIPDFVDERLADLERQFPYLQPVDLSDLHLAAATVDPERGRVMDPARVKRYLFIDEIRNERKNLGEEKRIGNARFFLMGDGPIGRGWYRYYITTEEFVKFSRVYEKLDEWYVPQSADENTLGGYYLTDPKSVEDEDDEFQGSDGSEDYNSDDDNDDVHPDDRFNPPGQTSSGRRVVSPNWRDSKKKGVKSM